MNTLMKVLRIVGLFAVFGMAHAQSYPDRPIKIIVPWPPGGAVDLLARPLAQRLALTLGQPGFVENKPGANGKSVGDIIALAKAEPGRLTYASFGTGSTAHLAGEMFKSMAGVDILHVPYKGGPPALTDVMAGNVFMMFATAPSVAALITNGELKAIATTGEERSPQTPKLPTMVESGLPGFEATTLYGAMFPADTPPEVVTKVGSAIRQIVSEPAVAQQLAKLGFQLQSSSPAQLSDLLKTEIVRWGKVVKQSGATAE